MDAIYGHGLPVRATVQCTIQLALSVCTGVHCTACRPSRHCLNVRRIALDQHTVDSGARQDQRGSCALHDCFGCLCRCAMHCTQTQQTLLQCQALSSAWALLRSWTRSERMLCTASVPLSVHADVQCAALRPSRRCSNVRSIVLDQHRVD